MTENYKMIGFLLLLIPYLINHMHTYVRHLYVCELANVAQVGSKNCRLLHVVSHNVFFIIASCVFYVIVGKYILIATTIAYVVHVEVQ